MVSISNPRKLNPTKSFNKNVITVRKGTIPQAGAVIPLPIFVTKMIIKNTHASINIGFNFNDDTSSNYWTLKPNEIISLDISEGTTIKIKGIGGDSSFEVIFS